MSEQKSPKGRLRTPAQSRTQMRLARTSVVFTLVLFMASNVALRASAEVYVHDIVTGSLTNTMEGAFNRDGFGFESLCEVSDRIKGFMDRTGSSYEIALVGPFPILYVVNPFENFGSNGNPTLDGGEFDGERLEYVLDQAIGVRDVQGTFGLEVALLGATGITTYAFWGRGAANGDALAVRNPTLSGGDFDGLLFTDIAVGEYVGYRGLLESQIAILGPSGINYYDIVTGTQVVPPFDPVISGGEFDGLRFSQLEPENFGGFRDQANGQILLVPEPSPVHALAIATGALCSLRRRRRSQA